LFIAPGDRWDAKLTRRFRDWLLAAIATELPHLRPPPD
jgi:hypothetical protein